MHFKFNIGATVVEYRIEFDYDACPFEFDIRSETGFLYNATLLERRLKAIDSIRFYRLVALNPVKFNGSTFYLDIAVQYYSGGPNLAWQLRQFVGMSDATLAAIEVWKRAMHETIIGTMAAHRTALHDNAKKVIRDQARRQATKMRDNAVLILRYLDEIEEPECIFVSFDEPAAEN